MNASMFQRAVEAIHDAKALLFTAGAGMGVDSGLPDFRGVQGFWEAYPPFARLGLNFQQLADPRWFQTDPGLAWGFYGHRLNLYRATQPHAGFAVLREWATAKPAHVFTSNVDGQFQRAGLHDVCEAHGSILHLQCVRPCRPRVWPAAGLEVQVDVSTMRAEGELPRCPHCGALARPAILMFGDLNWVEVRTAAQEQELKQFQAAHSGTGLTVIEMGAGTAVPTVRYFSEGCQLRGAQLVRINPRECQGPTGTISLECGAREALETLAGLLQS